MVYGMEIFRGTGQYHVQDIWRLLGNFQTWFAFINILLILLYQKVYLEFPAMNLY
jgi:uncharacterized membrane protein YecN with MAPEG domain